MAHWYWSHCSIIRATEKLKNLLWQKPYQRIKIYRSLETKNLSSDVKKHVFILSWILPQEQSNSYSQIQNLTRTEDRTSVKKVSQNYYSEKNERSNFLTENNSCWVADSFKSTLLNHCESVNDLLLDILLGITPYTTERKQKEEEVLGKSLL